MNCEILSLKTAGKLANQDKALMEIKALILFWKKYTSDNTMIIEQLEHLLHILESKNESKSRSIWKTDK